LDELLAGSQHQKECSKADDVDSKKTENDTNEAMEILQENAQGDEKTGYRREWHEDGCGEMEEFQDAYHSSNHAEPVF
jgi:hypothetical protein